MGIYRRGPSSRGTRGQCVFTLPQAPLLLLPSRNHPAFDTLIVMRSIIGETGAALFLTMAKSGCHAFCHLLCTSVNNFHAYRNIALRWGNLSSPRPRARCLLPSGSLGISALNLA